PIPEMDTRLIAQLDTGAEAGKSASATADGRIFRLPRQIRIEIEDVVIPNAVLRRAAGQPVPDALEKAARNQPGIGEAEKGKTRQDSVVRLIGEREIHELPLVHAIPPPASARPPASAGPDCARRPSRRGGGAARNAVLRESGPCHSISPRGRDPSVCR